MHIACLGWGSLIWEPCRGNHPTSLCSEGVVAGTVAEGGTWRTDGPTLPIEFLRHSNEKSAPNDYLSLVISPNDGTPVATLWTKLVLPPFQDVSAALRYAAERLCAREGCNQEWIKEVNIHGAVPPNELDAQIQTWAHAQGVDGVVWTALPPRWNRANGQLPGQADALTFLQSGNKKRAELYIRYAPPQIATKYRAAIEQALGWTPLAAPQHP